MNTNTGEVRALDHPANHPNCTWEDKLKPAIVPIDQSYLTPLQREQLARTGRTVVSRNSPCPCGSGKRFKRCCMTPHQR
jgi:uncharacterized protein YecA (UPF0149 family)